MEPAWGGGGGYGWELGAWYETASCGDWIHLAQYRDEWQAVVNRGMNLFVP
jgi:hypothetical protein